MYDKKHKIILLCSMIAAFALISSAIIYAAVSSSYTSTSDPKYDKIKEGHSIFQKKKFDESVKYADEYNKRQNTLNKMSSTPSTESTAPEVGSVQKAETSNKNTALNLYPLFKSGYVNTDQYIDAENKINKSVQALSALENATDFKNYYEANKKTIDTLFGTTSYNGAANIRNKFRGFTNNCSVSLIDNSISKAGYDIQLQIKFSYGNKLTIETIIIKYTNDISVNSIWQ